MGLKRHQDTNTPNLGILIFKMESDDSKKKLGEALRQVSRGSARTKTARLREIFDEVEAARASGVRHKTIVSTLANQGLVFDLKTFEMTRFRIAQERKAQSQQSEQKACTRAKATSSETRDQENSDANLPKEVGAKPVAASSSGSKTERLAPELKDLAVGADLSLDDEAYEQFRKKD